MMPEATVQLREATSADAEQIRALIAAVFAEYAMIWNAEVEVPDLFEIEKHYKNDETGAFFVGEMNGQIVGTVGITAEGARAEVHRLYVSPHHRRLGLGRKLMA